MFRNAISATEIQMPTSATECARLRKVVCRLAEAALNDPSAVADMELAIGEAFSNVVKHGNGSGTVRIKVESPESREIAIEMAYPGSQFDTTVRYPKNAMDGNGGFGRYIMKEITDSMEYQFDEGLTILRLTKRCA